MAGPKKLERGFAVTILGQREVIATMKGLADRALDLRLPLKVVADLLQAQTAENIRTRGGTLAERWPPLAEGTVKARRNRWGYYRAAPTSGVTARTPLVWAGGLAGSFTEGDPQHVQKLTSQSLEWGSKHPVIAFHNSRQPRTKIPFRPMLGFRDEGQKRVITVEPLRMWMRGMPVAQIRAEAFARSGIAFRRAG